MTDARTERALLSLQFRRTGELKRFSELPIGAWFFWAVVGESPQMKTGPASARQFVPVDEVVHVRNAEAGVVPIDVVTAARNVDDFLVGFAPIANSLAMAYGGRVLLCGSALVEPAPFDYDVRVVVPEDDLLRLFGPEARCTNPKSGWPDRRWKMAYDALKQSRRYSRIMGRNIDIQFQSEETAAKYADEPSRRIDSATDYRLSAGCGDA